MVPILTQTAADFAAEMKALNSGNNIQVRKDGNVPQIQNSKGYSLGSNKSSGLRNSYGNSFRSGLQNLSNYGSQAANMAGSLSNMGNALFSQFNQRFKPAMNAAAKLANVSEQQMADQATMGVNQAFDKMADQQNRQLARYGISPTSGRFQGKQQDLNLMRAAAEAGARNRARIQARDLSFNRNMQLAGMASPLASYATSNYGAATGALGTAGNLQNAYNNYTRTAAADQAAYEAYSGFDF
jgi:hypothetical protein